MARQAAALQAEERRRGTLGLGKNRAAVAVELGEGSAGSFIGGQVGGGGSGAGERDGGSPVALCVGRRWADCVVVPWAGGDRAQAALCRSRRRCALGSTRLRVALARLSSGGRARVRWWRGRQVGHGQGARAGRRTGRAGRAARPELGPRAACPGGERGRVSRGRGEGAGQARGRGGRREKREGEKRKENEENGKKKRKRKRRGKRREKGERERGIRAGITAPIAEPVGHAWRPGARERDARVEK